MVVESKFKDSGTSTHRKLFKKLKVDSKAHRIYFTNLEGRDSVLEEIQTLALKRELYEVKISGLGRKQKIHARLETLKRFASKCAAFADGDLRNIAEPRVAFMVKPNQYGFGLSSYLGTKEKTR